MAPFQKDSASVSSVPNPTINTSIDNPHAEAPVPALHDSVRSSRREPAAGVATVLALGRALPSTVIHQDHVAAGFFKRTGIDNPPLQAKLERICRNTTVKTRYMVMNKGILEAHPEFMDEKIPSIGQKLQVCGEELEKLGMEAANSCLAEWGRDRSSITHLIYVSSSEVRLPGGDLLVAQALGLSPDVNRVMLYMLGCYGGATALRVAKDLAENTKQARVLIVSSETTLIGWRPPNPDRPYDLVGAALFGDGAGAAIVGADPVAGEVPSFELRFASQRFVPGTSKTVDGTLTDTGLLFRLGRDLPQVIENNIEAFSERFFAKIAELQGEQPEGTAEIKSSGVSHRVNGSGTAPLDRPKFNDVFWAVHPGGPAILNAVERRLELEAGKLKASRDVLRDFGNVNSNTILYVLEYMREAHLKRAKVLAAGLPLPVDEFSKHDPEWGLLMAFGPGITMEGMLIRNLI